MTDPAAELVPMKRAAELLGVHRATLWRMHRDKQIRIVPMRGRKMVPVAEIERLVAEGTVPTDKRSNDDGRGNAGPGTGQ